MSSFVVFYDDEFDTNLSMHLNYNDKPRRCNVCAESHEGICPLEQQMEAERRAAVETDGNLPIKTYSDSTLVLGISDR